MLAALNSWHSSHCSDRWLKNDTALPFPQGTVTDNGARSVPVPRMPVAKRSGLENAPGRKILGWDQMDCQVGTLSQCYFLCEANYHTVKTLSATTKTVPDGAMSRTCLIQTSPPNAKPHILGWLLL
ncbi:UNVERIFIED_CONTAM: hypothetical protein FKN15_067670 [Acipenser sinensis]